MAPATKKSCTVYVYYYKMKYDDCTYFPELYIASFYARVKRSLENRHAVGVEVFADYNGGLTFNFLHLL